MVCAYKKIDKIKQKFPKDQIFAGNLFIETQSRNTSQFHGGNGRQQTLPCALTLQPNSHRTAITPSPCSTPHFMTRGRLLFSNSTPPIWASRTSLPPRCWATTCCRISFRPCAVPLCCSLEPLLTLLLLSQLQFVSTACHRDCIWNEITEPRSLSICAYL